MYTVKFQDAFGNEEVVAATAATYRDGRNGLPSAVDQFPR